MSNQSKHWNSNNRLSTASRDPSDIRELRTSVLPRVVAVVFLFLITACTSDLTDDGFNDVRQDQSCERKDSDYAPDLIELADSPMTAEEALQFAIVQERLPADGYIKSPQSDDVTKTYYVSEGREASVTVHLRWHPTASSWFPERIVACIDALETSDL